MRHAATVIAETCAFSHRCKCADINARADLAITPAGALKPYAQLPALANIEPSGLAKSRPRDGT